MQPPSGRRCSPLGAVPNSTRVAVRDHEGATTVLNWNLSAMSKSAIEWTDETWNPVTGCEKISPGCKRCYAERFAERFRGVKGHPYEYGFDPQIRMDRIHQPFTWRTPRMVFVNSMSDLFGEFVPDHV